LPSSRLTRAKSKSSSALAIHSRMIAASTIQDPAFFQNGLEERISHFQPFLEFLGTIYKEVYRDVAFDGTTQLPYSIRPVVGRAFLNDQKIGITVRPCITPRGAAKKDNLLWFVLFDELFGDTLDFSFEVHTHVAGLQVTSYRNIREIGS
jgi:hypothetical protein